MEKEYWKKLYKKRIPDIPTIFALFCSNFIDGKLVELGCGNGRDVRHFLDRGIDAIGVDLFTSGENIICEDVGNYIKNNKSPKNVYTRFFWHSIDDELQRKILKWVNGYIFIETRTDKDKPKNIFGKHKRNLTNVNNLLSELIGNKFEIVFLRQGRDVARYKKENPHILWIIAKKSQS